MQQFPWETSNNGDHKRGLHITEFSTLITGEKGELFKALPAPIQPTVRSNVGDPVEALDELIQMEDALVCSKFESKFDAMNSKFESKFDALRGRSMPFAQRLGRGRKG